MESDSQNTKELPSNHRPLNVIVIGLGHQSRDDHIPALIESNEFSLVAVCDSDEEVVSELSADLNVLGCTNIDHFLNEHHEKVDVALVAVPHHGYLPIIRTLAKYKKHIIKEKPIATSMREAIEIAKIVQLSGICLLLTLQRRYNPVFTTFAQLVKRIGKIHSIESRYVMNIENLDSGWRASSLYSGGGALVDLGYHYIDLLVWYFGLPELVNCHISTGNRENQKYDVEDTAFIQFNYNDNDQKLNHLLGNLVVSRVYPGKDEGLKAFGTKGVVEVKRGSVQRISNEGTELEKLERQGSWPSALIDQLDACAIKIKDKQQHGSLHHDYLKHIAFIEAAYLSSKLKKPIEPQSILKKIELDIKGFSLKCL